MTFLPDAAAPPPGYVLVVDQTAGDARSSALLSEDLAATAQGQYALVERFNR